MCVCVCVCVRVHMYICICVCICMQSDFCCPLNSAVLRPKFGAPNLCGVQRDLFCLHLCCPRFLGPKFGAPRCWGW